jgi:hypothetical protein
MQAGRKGVTTAAAADRKGAGDPYTGRCLLGFIPERSSPKGRGGVAQGPVRRRVRSPSDDAAESGRALVSSMMEPIALTKSSPDAAGAGRTAVGLRLLKPKRARVGKEESCGSWNRFSWSLPLGRLVAPLLRTSTEEQTEQSGWEPDAVPALFLVWQVWARLAPSWTLQRSQDRVDCRHVSARCTRSHGVSLMNHYDWNIQLSPCSACGSAL